MRISPSLNPSPLRTQADSPRRKWRETFYPSPLVGEGWVRGIRVLLSAICLMLFCGIAAAGVPIVSQMETTDVTPGSFAVTWVSSEPATAALFIYQSDCTTPLTGLSMTNEKNDATGVIKVTVSGLSSNSSYCYQTVTTSILSSNSSYCYQTVTTSISTSEAITNPSQPVSVSTARSVKRVMNSGGLNVPFGNDLLRVPELYLPSVSDTPGGILEVLYLDGGRGPISLLLTNDDKKHYFNMNNLFDAATGNSINLFGGERVRISERHGRTGCVIERFRRVPADAEITRFKGFTVNSMPQDIDYNGTVNILDILRVAGGNGQEKGGSCFNSELDLNGDNTVDLSDIQSSVGSFDETP